MSADRPAARISSSEVARRTFGMVRRGFDPEEVRAYLEVVGRELSAYDEREERLREALHAADERAKHPVVNEDMLTAALGQQSAQVLRHAHEESSRIVQQAEEAAAGLLHDAQQQANDLQVRAEAAAAERIAQAELAVAGVRSQAEGEVHREHEQARSEHEAVLTAARDQGRAMIEKAQEARRRVLTDLAQRRRLLQVQIEQLRAARDRLAESVLSVRGSVDAIVGGLANADDEARAAAAEVSRRLSAETPEPEGQLAELEADMDEEPAPEAAPPPEPPPAPVVSREPPGEPQSAPVVSREPPTEAGPGPSGGEGPAGRQSVEDLFARIRASQATGDAGAEGQAERASGGVATLAVPAPPDVPTVEAVVEEQMLVDTGPDAVLLEARTELLQPVTTQLARRLKRALQDDQNRLLDRLRSRSAAGTPDDLFPEDEEAALYVEASVALLQEAANAGVAFAASHGGGVAAKASPSQLARPVAGRLASTVVAPLRRRLAGEDGLGSAESAEDTVERVGAAYREWRGERIERLVGDAALEAFSAGVTAAPGEGTGLRWVLAGDGPACADCDDNALAGVVRAGEEFPTGHRHPPAHAGCRCLVVPTPA